LEFQRISIDIKELETRAKSLEPDVNARNKELEEATKSIEYTEVEINDLREMLESAKRWRETAMKIASLREQAVQKEDYFSMMNSDKQSRDLKTVTEDIAESERKKDEYVEKINVLNKEMSKINDDVSSLAQTATRLENNYRTMQEKFNEEVKMEEKKTELATTYADLKSEYEQVSIS
jgi:chromosome segregation ATPase